MICQLKLATCLETSTTEATPIARPTSAEEKHEVEATEKDASELEAKTDADAEAAVETTAETPAVTVDAVADTEPQPATDTGVTDPADQGEEAEAKDVVGDLNEGTVYVYKSMNLYQSQLCAYFKYICNVCS